MGRPLKATKLPQQDRLRQLLEYNANTGSLVWRDRAADDFPNLSPDKAGKAAKHWRSMYAGKEVGSSGEGYIRLTIDGVHYYAQRVIWKLVHGTDPIEVDHINGQKSDNRLCNLRDVSHQVNGRNRQLYANNKSGVIGISFHPRDKVWSARISIGGSVDKHLGSFKTKEEAIAARIGAEIVLEYHANHGRSAVERKDECHVH